MVSNQTPRNLIIQTAFLGDLLLSIPLIRGVQKRFPNHELDLVARKGLGELFVKAGLVTRVHEIEKGNARSYHEIRKQLSGAKIDQLFSPHESIRTAIFISGLRAQRKIGFHHWWNSFFFSERVPRPMHLPDALRQLSLLSVVDPGLVSQLEQVQMRYHNRAPLYQKVDLSPLPEWASMNLRSQLGFSEERLNRVVIAPGSQWATKRWSVEGFIEVGQTFVQKGFEIHLVGTGTEKEICESVQRGIPGSVNHCGKTNLWQLTELLSTARFLLANDSGVMHLGSVVDLPTVAVFGPTTLDLGYRPWQNRALVVEKNMKCRPCGKHGHDRCPIGTHDCMKRISATDVIRTFKDLQSE